MDHCANEECEHRRLNNRVRGYDRTTHAYRGVYGSYRLRTYTVVTR